jgi:hypothetical protein
LLHIAYIKQMKYYNSQIVIRMNAREKAALDAYAASIGTSTGKLMRELALKAANVAPPVI